MVFPIENSTPLTLTQSLVIINYLETIYPSRGSLLPKDPIQCARTLELVYTIACDTHPMQNLRILTMQPEEKRADYAQAIIASGLSTFEALLEPESLGRGYCVGEQVSLADLVLVPQVYNARRWKLDLTPYPRIRAICEHLEQLPAFIVAHPDQQADAPPMTRTD